MERVFITPIRGEMIGNLKAVLPTSVRAVDDPTFHQKEQAYGSFWTLVVDGHVRVTTDVNRSEAGGVAYDRWKTTAWWMSSERPGSCTCWGNHALGVVWAT